MYKAPSVGRRPTSELVHPCPRRTTPPQFHPTLQGAILAPGLLALTCGQFGRVDAVSERYVGSCLHPSFAVLFRRDGWGWRAQTRLEPIREEFLYF